MRQTKPEYLDPEQIRQELVEIMAKGLNRLQKRNILGLEETSEDSAQYPQNQLDES